MGSHVGATVSTTTGCSVGKFVGGFDTGGGGGSGVASSTGDVGEDGNVFPAASSPSIPHAGVSTQLLVSSQKKLSPTLMY